MESPERGELSKTLYVEPGGRGLIHVFFRATTLGQALHLRWTIEEGEPPEPPAPPMTGSCTHSFGGVYANRGCSPSFQCCDGAWVDRAIGCGACDCEEATGRVGCQP